MKTLRIGGITPLTTIDFPGELAAVVFCQGCPWRCCYCQNSHLLPSQGESDIPWSDVLSFLERRRGLLDAVVFSGGEPTLQAGLPEAVAEVRALGFKVGLHTAGCYPDRLSSLLPVLDWVGLDIKALPEDYPLLTGVQRSGERAWESLMLLLTSGVDYEVRTTVVPDWIGSSTLAPLAERLASSGVDYYVLQSCQTRHCLDASLRGCATPPPLSPEEQLKYMSIFKKFSVR